MTIQSITLDVIPAEQGMYVLQAHNITWTGYALTLVRQANLTSEEAARIFMQAMMPYVSTSTSANAALLERQAMQAAEMMVLLHGHANVRLERDEEAWLLRVTLTELKEGLEVWGVPLEFFTRWMSEQARLVGESKGINYKTWLDGETLYMQLSLITAQ